MWFMLLGCGVGDDFVSVGCCGVLVIWNWFGCVLLVYAVDGLFALVVIWWLFVL